jgi:hypothetical protein
VLPENAHLSNAGDCARCGDCTDFHCLYKGINTASTALNTATVDSNGLKTLQLARAPPIAQHAAGSCSSTILVADQNIDGNLKKHLPTEDAYLRLLLCVPLHTQDMGLVHHLQVDNNGENPIGLEPDTALHQANDPMDILCLYHPHVSSAVSSNPPSKEHDLISKLDGRQRPVYRTESWRRVSCALARLASLRKDSTSTRQSPRTPLAFPIADMAHGTNVLWRLSSCPSRPS